MIKSMTGFASLTRDDERGALGVTIRSVNHRFLDLQLRLPQALTIRERLPEAGGVSALLGGVVDEAVLTALQQLEEMRVREGVHLRNDLDVRKALLAGLITRIATAANTGRQELEARLLERAREIAAALPIDQAALSQEVVRVAQRSDISEEVTRFHGHLAHW